MYTSPATPQTNDNDSFNTDDTNTSHPELGHSRSSSSFSSSSYTLDKSVYSAKPVIGWVERIPLSLKLILVVVVPILSLITFGALLISHAVNDLRSYGNIINLSTYTLTMVEVIHRVQRERGYWVMYLASEGKMYGDQLREARNLTDQAIATFKTHHFTADRLLFVRHYDDIVARSLVSLNLIEQSFTNLSKWREDLATMTNTEFKCEDIQNSALNPLSHFCDWIKTMIDLVVMVSTQVSDPLYVVTQNDYCLLNNIRENLSNLNSIGGCALTVGSLTPKGLLRYRRLQQNVKIFTYILYLKSSRSVYSGFLQTVNTSAHNSVKEMENSLILSSSNISNITFSSVQWFENFILYVDSMDKVEEALRLETQAYVDNLGRRAIISLVAFAICTILVICISLFFALLFSRTILSPWRRVLQLQEDTVHKFVPREFMSIVNKDRLSDLRYGDYFEKELDIMFVDIRNYTGISESLSAEDLFKFLNTYLSIVGPVISINKGYIDKYMGDGFIALFIKPGHVINASIEIQKRVRELNETKQFPPFAVGCGIGRGKCAVGLVGECKRMDPTIIGDVVNLSARLESLTKQYGANILVSKSVIDSSPHFKNHSNNNKRNIGKVLVVGKKEAVELHEIIPFEDSPKRRTIELFEKSSEYLFNFQSFDPASAIRLLSQVLSIDPSDALAKLRLPLAERLLNNPEGWMFYDSPTAK